MNIFQKLFRQKIEMNISNNNDNHFLYLIVYHLQYKIVQIFVVNDVDINYNNKKLKISLMIAIEKCFAKMNFFIFDFLKNNLRNKIISSIKTKFKKYQHFIHCKFRKTIKSNDKNTQNIAIDDELKLI